MINEIKSQCEQIFNKDYKSMGIYLVRFDGEKGIVKCNHIEKDNTIKLLNSIKEISSQKIEVETVGTSGTIKSLTKKFLTN